MDRRKNKTYGRYFTKEEQQRNFLNGLTFCQEPHITERGLAMAKELGVETQYRQIIEDIQNEQASLLVQKISLCKEQAVQQKISETINTQLYIDQFEKIYYEKVQEFGISSEISVLNESEMELCFEQACKEFSSFYPGEDFSDFFGDVSKKLLG